MLTGPAGSGKTTTIYACLRHLAELGGRHIITVEDPVEQIIPGTMQTEVNEAIGLDFARAARHLLRQDPQVLIIGEIRDEATAQLAVRAGLTGHLVISTLHAGSCRGVFERLLAMCADHSAVASAVELVLNQRLIRKTLLRVQRRGLRNLFAHRLSGPRAAGRMAARERKNARANPPARTVLADPGANPGSLGARAGGTAGDERGGIQTDFRLMKHDEFAFFNQQLAAMLRDGIPLEGALRRLCEEMRRGALRDELQALEADLAKGTPHRRRAETRASCPSFTSA